MPVQKSIAPTDGSQKLSDLASFPGAQGYGANTPGGRGGEVYEVTTLQDSGPGSLRDAVSCPNRTIVFRISGTIALKSQLLVVKPFLTLAGQTAPGGGICIRDYDVRVCTHDIIVRHLRFRIGDLTQTQEDSFTLGNGARHCVVDHCSATWSIDEALSLTGDVANCTIQWCLIAEALNKSCHVKGDHGYGTLARANGPITFHHNLWAHNDSRNPRLGDNYNRAPFPFFDFRNNVIYDYGQICSGWTQGVFQVNYLANYIRPGPSSSAPSPIFIAPESRLIYHIRGNVWEGHDRETADNSLFFSATVIDGRKQLDTTDQPFDALPVQTSSAAQAYQAVLDGAGATKPRRDSVDARIVAQVRQGSGKIIDSQADVGSWPTLENAPAPQDSDHDGMPDDWEKRHGHNPNDPSDAAADHNADGYTNLEDYLNSLA